MANDISDIEYRVVSAVSHHWRVYKRGPTYEQIAEYTGSSSSTAWRRVQKLINRGILTADESQHRTIALVPEQLSWWSIRFSDGTTVVVSGDDKDRAVEVACFTKWDQSVVVDVMEFTGTLESVVQLDPNVTNLEVVFQVKPEDEE